MIPWVGTADIQLVRLPCRVSATCTETTTLVLEHDVNVALVIIVMQIIPGRIWIRLALLLTVRCGLS